MPTKRQRAHDDVKCRREVRAESAQVHAHTRNISFTRPAAQKQNIGKYT